MSSGIPSSWNIPEKDIFAGKKYPRFELLLLIAARARGVSGYLDGSITKPSAPVIPVPTAATAATAASAPLVTPLPPDPTPWISTTPSYHEWVVRDAYTLAMIVNNVSDTVGLGVRTDGSAYEAYESLQLNFSVISDLGLVNAERELRDLRYTDNQNFDDHISSMRTSWTAANAQGAMIDDLRFRGIVIASLPTSWNIIIAGLDSHKTSGAVISRLRMWDTQVNGGSLTSGTSSTQALAAVTPDAIAIAVAQAMAAYTRNNQQTRRPSNGLICSNEYCTTRKRTGHTIDNCFMPGGGKEGQYPEWYKGKKVYAPGKGPVSPTAALANATPPTTRSSSSLGHDQFDFMALMADTSTSGPATAATGTITYADSGASDHCFVNREDFATYQSVTRTSGQTAHADTRFRIIGKGTVYKNISHNGVSTILELTNCLHTPDLTANLVSIASIARKGVTVKFNEDFVEFSTPAGSSFMSGTISGGMYVLHLLPVPPKALISHSRSQSRPASFETWHRRLGHVGDVRLKELKSKDIVDGLEFTSLVTHGQCEDCIYGKQSRRPFDELVTHETRVLERIHIDLWGPSRTFSAGGKRYMMICVDGASSCRDGFFLADKRSATTLVAFQTYVAKAERQTGCKVKIVRVDGGGEFEGGWITWCEEKGIVIETTTPYSSSANGVSERGIRTTFDKTRSMLKDAGLPPKYWAEVASTAIYLQNFLPSSRHPSKTPYELFSKMRPDISHLRAFGCVAYLKIPIVHTDGKLAPRSLKTTLIGYYGRGSYRLLDRSTGQFHRSRDVIFEEGVANRTLTNYPSNTFDSEDTFDFPTAVPVTSSNHPDPNIEAGTEVIPDPVPIPASTQIGLPIAPIAPNLLPPIEPRRSTRNRVQTTALNNSIASEAAIDSAANEGMAWANNTVPARALLTVNPDDLWIPRTYSEAMSRPDLWGGPIQKEIDRLTLRKVWHLVERSPSVNIMKTKWVFDIKFDGEGRISSRKARLVAKGFTQIPGVDFFDTYASVVRYESLRITLAIAAAKGWKTWAIDFVSAFLNSRMKEKVYMDQPEGMVVKGSEGMIAQLDFSLYGTMQGASNWWDELDGAYKDLGYRRSHADQSVRVREGGTGTTITSTYTDDVTGVSSSTKEANVAKEELGKRYDIKDLGDLDFVLGIKIAHNPADGSIALSQRAYTERILKRFGMESCNPKRTPLPPGISLSASSVPLSTADHYYMQDKPYREVLGSIMYLMIATRPDLAFSVNVLSSFASNPGPPHWNAMLYTLGYLHGTLDYRIIYHKDTSLVPVGFVDADYGGYMDTRRSTSGELYIMAGGLVSWGAHHERTVALSTAESEYMAAARGARQMDWIYSFMSELNLPQPRPALLRCDNQAAIALSQSSKGHSRVKHIDIRHHYIRERVEEGALEIRHIPGLENIADIMTKPLSFPRHQDLIIRMGLSPPTS